MIVVLVMSLNWTLYWFACDLRHNSLNELGFKSQNSILSLSSLSTNLFNSLVQMMYKMLI